VTGNGYKTVEALRNRAIEPIRVGRSLRDFEAGVATLAGSTTL
jgi:hypothetical protein